MGVAGYIIKPISEKNLIPAIEIGMAKTREVEKMKKEMNDTMEKLEARKLIEKAKGIIIEREEISESSAYEKLRKLSMDKRISMEEISKIIILSYEGD